MDGAGRQRGRDTCGTITHHSSDRGQPKLSSTNAINQQRTKRGSTQVVDLEDTVEDELLIGVLDSNTVENQVEVVRDKTVTRPGC